jgi:multidrug efflux pump subunit AcrA (membrane-fusion protein)
MSNGIGSDTHLFTPDQRHSQPAKDQVANSPGSRQVRKTSTSSWARRILYGILALAVIAGMLLAGWLPREKRNEQIQAKAKAQKSALPTVEVMTVHQVSSQRQLTLPGTVTPAMEVHVLARASGYVKARYVDLGDRVHKDQLLAVIAAPELDAIVVQQQAMVEASRSALSKAQSDLRFQQVTYDRTHTLVVHGVLSQQDDDAGLAAVESSSALAQSAQNSVAAAQGALAHALALASFERVLSPIDGTVTARNVETGTLISAAGTGQGLIATPNAAASGGPPTGGAQGGELFAIADLSNLEVFISVPEADAVYVQTGQKADLTFSQMPEQQFTGTVVRGSDALDQETRTLLLRVHVNDPQHRLRPGMFASVQLSYHAPDPGILIAGDSVFPMAQGEFVPVVQNGVIHLQPVRAGRDLGTQVYITAGLKDGDTVVINPTDEVKEGVHVVTRPAPKGQEQ